MCSVTRFIAMCSLALTYNQVSAQAITVEYRDKPPYSYTEAGRPSGFLLERTAQIFKRAGVEAQFVEMPVRRTLANLQTNATLVCSPGLYKLPEREAFARFSLPMHRDRPHVVLARADVEPAVRASRSLTALFANPTLTLGVLDGVSYGADLDALIAGAVKPPERAQLSPLQLATLVSRRRVDYMLIDQEDLGWLRRSADFATLKLAVVEFHDMPRGQLRYIACSRRVDPAVLERLNGALRELMPELAGE